MEDTWKNHFDAFVRGYWDSVQFAYIPDYNKIQLEAWQRGYLYGKDGNSEPSFDDFEALSAA